ncbi:MAG: hypothetical protein AAB267_07940, partial [Candidatus Desantisbacteria bacterium]
MVKRIILGIGAVSLLPSLIFGAEYLFPHEIWVDNKPIVKLEEVSECIKIEACGLTMKIEPQGSISISSQEESSECIKIEACGLTMKIEPQ